MILYSQRDTSEAEKYIMRIGTQKERAHERGQAGRAKVLQEQQRTSPKKTKYSDTRTAQRRNKVESEKPIDTRIRASQSNKEDENKEDNNMKFYYNGKLVRTSKNHVYTHACIDMQDMDLRGCSSTIQGAEKVKRDEIGRLNKSIINLKSRLKALETGKDRYWYKDGRTGCYEAIRKDSPYHTIESTKKSIQNCLEQIEYIEKNWQVVELEAREK